MEDHIMKIAVARTAGRPGRHVSEVLAERGHQVVAVSGAIGVEILLPVSAAGAAGGCWPPGAC
jgi:hypothetical protein